MHLVIFVCVFVEIINFSKAERKYVSAQRRCEEGGAWVAMGH